MRETHVVTCFVMDPEGKLLILCRSGRVGTYQGRWAGVSGFLEGAPEQQAYTELSEEVGLSASDVSLLAAGEPLAVDDAGLDRRWIVHPFLFQLHDPTRIRLDWEHTEYRWIDPEEMASFPTVPGLQEALNRVRRDR